MDQERGRVLEPVGYQISASSVAAHRDRPVGQHRRDEAEDVAVGMARLRQVVPLLEELEVTGFIAEDGCRWLLYERGQFFDGGESCQPDRAVAFDGVALADHARIVATIEASGAPTRRINQAHIGADGRLQGALFVHSAHPWPDYWGYVYDRGNREPKVDGGPLEVDYTRVDATWWFMSSLDD
jgi:hypothetical protein